MSQATSRDTFIVISAQTRNAVEKQIRPREKYPNVTVIDAIGLVQSRLMQSMTTSENADLASNTDLRYVLVNFTCPHAGSVRAFD
jgi:hypothetical protein